MNFTNNSIMKNLNIFKTGVLVLLLSLAFTGCQKFEVLSNIDPELEKAGENLKTQTIWQFISSRTDNKSRDTLKSLDLYAAQIERVGLKSLLDSASGNFTIIAPRNQALKDLAGTLGYPSIDAVPTALLRNIFLDNMIAKRIKSFDVEAGKFQVEETLNEDSISFGRQPSATDKYVFNLYNAPTSSSALVKVRSQNLECKNGVVHVVDAMSVFKPKYLAKEVGKLPGDTIYVTKDSYMNNGGATKEKLYNFGSDPNILTKKNSSANLTRRGILQFPITSATFSEPIANVTLALYSTRVDAPGGVVSIYKDQQVDWDESLINWSNAPTPGTTILSSSKSLNIFPQTAPGKWVTFEVTDAYNAALANNDLFINLGVNTAVNASFYFATKEAVDSLGVIGGYKPYLVLTPPSSTLLTDLVNNGITVSLAKGYHKISVNDLSFSGTTSNNVVYSIADSDLPNNGFLVVNGFKSSQFTQAQIEKGSVKYLYNGDGPGSDSFTLTAKDFNGGSYPDPIVVNVTIQ